MNKESEILKINGCRECPFFYINKDGDYFCSNQKRLKELSIASPIIDHPTWCPLLKRSITITLEKRTHKQ